MKKNFYYTLGRPLSPLYSLAMLFREYAYQRGLLKSSSFTVPVISVGNLTMGGSGKTPLVRHLALLLQQKGFQPAIISRGYGGATKKRVNIVSDGAEVLLTADQVGDEPVMLAASLPGVFVLTGVVRKLPAAQAVEMGADVLILDDGFQHLAINRTIDLVLFNATTLAGNSRVFPGGDLREPVKGLQRANAFIMTGVNDRNRERAERFTRLLQDKFPHKPLFSCAYRVSGVAGTTEHENQGQLSLDTLILEKCFAFCGIAHPERFQQTLKELSIVPVGFKPLPDHHGYGEKIMRQICREAEQADASCLLCTEKDLIKLSGFAHAIPLYAITMEVQTAPELDQMILSRLQES